MKVNTNVCLPSAPIRVSRNGMVDIQHSSNLSRILLNKFSNDG